MQRVLQQTTRNIFRRLNNQHYRFQTTKTQNNINHDHDEAQRDFRPPWIYITSRLITFTIIPGVAFYSIFFYDFGDRDHVFQPARRWALEQKASFFTPSPEEEEFIRTNKQKAEIPNSIH